MINQWKASALVLACFVSACSGDNPFLAQSQDEEADTPPPTTDPVDPEPDSAISPAVPDVLLDDLESFAYDPDTDTLTVTGLTQDGVPIATDYTKVAVSYVAGYETYTAQNDPLGRHVTAFVASRDGVRAGVLMSGGQFNRVFSGVYYERDAAFDPIVVTATSGDVSYFGNYAGLINGPGPDGNLLPVTVTGPDAPNTAAYVSGLIFLNVDFADMAVEGEIYDRVAQFDDGSGGADPYALPDIVLINSSVTDVGDFQGDVEIEGAVGIKIGDYGGILSGEESSQIAGGISIAEFDAVLENEIEYGVFLLDVCDASRTEPECQNSL